MSTKSLIERRDFALFDENLKIGINGTYTNGAADYPTIITIGPAYFESYQTWPDVRFVHGFNLGKNKQAEKEGTWRSMGYACKALGDGKLLYWEHGNEPDLFVNRIRPKDWDEEDYAIEWLEGTRKMREVIRENCPELDTDEHYRYITPSFAGLTNSLQYTEAVPKLVVDDNVGQISAHK